MNILFRYGPCKRSARGRHRFHRHGLALYFMPMNRSRAVALRSVVLGLAFLFATVGRVVVDAALYHGGDAVDASRQIHVEALDNPACHDEACALSALVAPLRHGPLGPAGFRGAQLPAIVEVDQPDAPLYSSHYFTHARPRAPPLSHA